MRKKNKFICVLIFSIILINCAGSVAVKKMGTFNEYDLNTPVRIDGIDSYTSNELKIRLSQQGIRVTRSNKLSPNILSYTVQKRQNVGAGGSWVYKEIYGNLETFSGDILCNFSYSQGDFGDESPRIAIDKIFFKIFSEKPKKLTAAQNRVEKIMAPYQNYNSESSQKNEVYLPPPPDNTSFIAVVDFGGNNVSEGDCRALTDRLRAELFNTKHYKVIEREMMEQIIEEQGFQQSGCSTDECMVEVGKLIGVEKIVGGSISKVGRTYSVSSRIVSVENGKILKGATYDYKGEIDELLTNGMKMVAYELIK